MKVPRPLGLGFLVLPVILVLLWHFCNQGLPNDDAATFAETSLRIAKQFHERGVISGVYALWGTRGWRPIAFPPLAVPFLLLTRNNVVAAAGATLLVIYAILVLYLYRLACLCSPDSSIAAVACSAAASLPAIVDYSLIFFSESAWLLFSIACTYHLLRSGPFKVPVHALAAGFCGGLMLTIRPVESAIVLVVLLAFLINSEARFKDMRARDCLAVGGLFCIPASLLVLSGRFQGVTSADIWAASAGTAVIGRLLPSRYNRSLIAFFTALISVSCIWWAGFMPALFAWIHGSLIYNSTAQITTMDSAGRILQALSRQAQDYGRVQVGVFTGVALFLIGSRMVRRVREQDRSASAIVASAPALLLLRASSTMLLIFAVIYSIGGSDRRRALVAVALFIVSLVTLAAARSRLISTAILVLIGLQVTVIGRAVAGIPFTPAMRKFGRVPVPYRGEDGNYEILRQLAKYVSPGSAVAVYTLALFRADARIYEPAALQLAAFQQGHQLALGYPWDVGSYEGVLARLRQDRYKYLLLDSFSEVNPGGTHEPYVHFAADLLQRMHGSEPDIPGLRVLAQFQVRDRLQTLFGILPQTLTQETGNLAAEGSGSRAIATESQEGYPASNLNDGSDNAWGSLEGRTDVYAGVVLPSAKAIHTIRLRLFTPNGRPHLHNIRVVAADSEGVRGPEWLFVRSKLKGSKEFSSVITIPPSPDNSVVTIELDDKDAHWRSHSIWGIACLRSKGDKPNYLSVGSGVYVRELEIGQ